MSEKRYTLSLPPVIYNEIREQAERNNTTIGEVVRQVLKFGLAAIELQADPNTELIIREKVTAAGGTETEVRETRLKFIF